MEAVVNEEEEEAAHAPVVAVAVDNAEEVLEDKDPAAFKEEEIAEASHDHTPG